MNPESEPTERSQTFSDILQLGMTVEEIREQVRNAGIGKGDLDTFFDDGYLPYMPPPERAGGGSNPRTAVSRRRGEEGRRR